MIEEISGEYDRRMYPSDWRYSAAIVGMIQFLESMEMEDYVVKDEYLGYMLDNISGEEMQRLYLKFVEEFFEEYMHHVMIQDLLEVEELNEDQEKKLKEKLSANTICKKVFSGIKNPKEQKEEIKNLIFENREKLILETYKHGNLLYAKFANSNKLFSNPDKVCRLVGYYVDLPKKGKSISYRWNYDTYIAKDCSEFDFIPFGFIKGRDSYFVNNNMDIKMLCNTRKHLQDFLDEQKYITLLTVLVGIENYINWDVELIRKRSDADYYESFFVRKEDAAIAKKLYQKCIKTDKGDIRYSTIIDRPCRLGNGEYLMVGDIVADSIINRIHLDDTILILLKEEDKELLTEALIYANTAIYGGGDYMEKKNSSARFTAQKVTESLMKKLAGNTEGKRKKIDSYKQKLISALCFHDYDRFCEVLMRLSSLSEVPFEFAYVLYDDFETNKNIAFTFATALGEMPRTKQENEMSNVDEKKGV